MDTEDALAEMTWSRRLLFLIFIPIAIGVAMELGAWRGATEVCVYAGSGAVLAGDVEAALERIGVHYREVDEGYILRGGLRRGCAVLIIPGGYTAEMVSALGVEGLEEIRGFVQGGGLYIGICAGAYIAARRVEAPGRPEGLGIINVTNVRLRGIGVVEVEVVDPGHPLVEGCPETISIWYQNGPHMKPGRGVEVAAVYEDGSAAIVSAPYGEGLVILFSPHPEGSSEGDVDPEELGTLRLLENALKMRGTQ
ncbi:MAG: hypothetical protein AYL28_001360 [Candidatus Bathyarchaeota archaeon B23]|nr:MAG: hypothetical protein AYL28_001360 [Candidatus Bathyarchaeota archaeon B23]